MMADMITKVKTTGVSKPQASMPENNC